MTGERLWRPLDAGGGNHCLAGWRGGAARIASAAGGLDIASAARVQRVGDRVGVPARLVGMRPVVT